MVKKAYISIEGRKTKLFIKKGKEPKRGEFYEVETEELLSFIKQRGIKEVKLAQFIPNLINFKFPLPFTSKIKKKKKILNTVVFNEIRKKYPALQYFSFIYNVHETAGRTFVRCYLADDESLSIPNKLILEGINVTAFYPVFLPLIEFIKAKQKEPKEAQLICLLSHNMRMLFLLKEDEMLLQRSFEAEEKNLTDEDVININMTMSYSIQNFRIKPEKVTFIGAEKQEISGLTIPYDFVDFSEDFKNYSVPYFLFQFEKKLEGKEMFLPEYKRFLQNRKYLSYAVFVFLIFAFLLVAYNIKILSEVEDYKKTLNFYRKEVSAKERDFLLLQDSIRNFEKNLKPYMELQNKWNSFNDVRAPIEPISEASKIKGIEISSIDIENTKPQRMKILGKITTTTFTERQQIFMDFKNIAQMKGLKITNEKWDFTKGEFTIEGEYDSQRVLQK